MIGANEVSLLLRSINRCLNTSCHEGSAIALTAMSKLQVTLIPSPPPLSRRPSSEHGLSDDEVEWQKVDAVLVYFYYRLRSNDISIFGLTTFLRSGAHSTRRITWLCLFVFVYPASFRAQHRSSSSSSSPTLCLHYLLYYTYQTTTSTMGRVLLKVRTRLSSGEEADSVCRLSSLVIVGMSTPSLHASSLY